MTTNRAVAGLVALITIYFLITLGWDFPYARVFAFTTAFLFYKYVRMTWYAMDLEDAVRALVGGNFKLVHKDADGAE